MNVEKIKTILGVCLYLLFFRAIGTKAWSMHAGYDSQKEALHAAEQMIEGGPYEFKVICTGDAA